MPDPVPVRLSLVLDTTVLSNFAVIGQTHLLERLYRGQACTTLMVMDEIRRGLDAGYEYLQSVERATLQPDGWLQVVTLESAEEHRLYLDFSSSLGPGESACLTVAIQRGLTLASDDLAARRAASQYGVRLTGTLGILIRLVRDGHLTLESANDLLGKMTALGYHSPVGRLDEFIHATG